MIAAFHPLSDAVPQPTKSSVAMIAFLRVVIAFLCAYFVFAASLSAHAQTPQVCPASQGASYATWSGSGNSGTGTFSANGTRLPAVPNYTWAITGDLSSNSIDNYENFSGANQLEGIYGQADNASNLNPRVQGNNGSAGQPIIKSMTTTMTFDSPTPNYGFGFAMIDIDSEQIQVLAKDSDGNDVPPATVASWFIEVFDANPSSNGTDLPSWDPAKPALIGNKVSGSTWQTNMQSNLGDDEAPGGWFQPNISLSTLTIYLEPVDNTGSTTHSIHIYMASCLEERDHSDVRITGNAFTDATHGLVSGFHLGLGVTRDTAPYNSVNADGDSDDGITIPTLIQGKAATITSDISGSGGYLQGWIDWNGDGDWDDPGEQIASDVQGSGSVSIPVNVPASASTNQIYARFRWSGTAGLDTVMAASKGEVEDYQFTILEPPNIVINTNDSGTGSLRAAVDYVNANTDDDNITFDIPGAGPHTITLTNSLELLDDGISVDGTTQSGASCGDLWSGTPHTLKVRISSSTGFFNAFKLNGLNISLRGLSITNNTFAGVGVIGGTNQTIACSYLGLTPAGTAAPNRYGVVDRGVGTVIGGPNPGDGNVISSNGFSGIISMIAASATTIEGNFIGTNPLGLSAMPNGQGIGNDLASGSATWDAVQGNLISGNSGAGIHLTNDNPVSGSSGDAVISGNYIGVDRTGNTALANGGDGINFEAGSISGVTIGGTNVADRNIISGNTGDGIAFSGVDTITILGNSIGLGADGTTAVGNTGTGVSILAAATGVQIGNGSSSGANVITNNGADGIYSSGDDFFALANNIYGNGGLGIDLSGGTEDVDGVTANDSGDGDAGPNNLLNFPIINELSVAGSTLNYDINLDAPANTDGYRVDFYKSTEADASSYGEGEIHLGFVDITHAGGDLNFTGIFTANDTVAEGNTISATTTRKTVASSYDISSEFSLTYSAIASAAELTASKSVTVYDPSILGLYILPGNDVIYSLTATNIGNGNADADTIVLMENVPPEISFYNGDMDDGGPILNPVSFVEGETTGLTFTYGTDVAYSNSGTKPTNFAACNFIPAAGYDNNVTYICVNPKGEMAPGDPDPNFTIAYRARIK